MATVPSDVGVVCTLFAPPEEIRRAADGICGRDNPQAVSANLDLVRSIYADWERGEARHPLPREASHRLPALEDPDAQAPRSCAGQVPFRVGCTCLALASGAKQRREWLRSSARLESWSDLQRPPAFPSDEGNGHLLRRGVARSATRLRSISFEETRCTSHAKPAFSIVQMSHQVGSNCHGCRPCLADLGKAWWLW